MLPTVLKKEKKGTAFITIACPSNITRKQIYFFCLSMWRENVTSMPPRRSFRIVTLHYYFWKINTWCTLKCVIFHNSQKLLLSVISHCFHQFLMIYFNKNTPTCERNTIKIDKREKIPDIFFDTLLFFTQKCSQERKQISYGDLNGKCFHHSEITRNTSH